MKYSAILLAAGKGTRYKGTKQDVFFHDKPLWRFAYDTTASVVDTDRIVVVGKDVAGGATRAGSVLNGLNAIPEDTDRVIIVEAARPMVTKEQILQLLNDDSPSTTLVRPFVNSVMFRDGTYVDRNSLYDMLSPQAFDYKLLLEAYRSGHFENATEETRVMLEFHGIKPHFIETGNNLFKVTYPGDLAIIESIYQSLQSEGKI